jgi:predicted dehydrogenase
MNFHYISEQTRSAVRSVIIGQIGVGNWGRALLRNFSSLEEVRLKKICDLNPAMLQKVRSDYPQSELTTKDEEIFKDDEIEAVVIASPSTEHARLAGLALNAGKHVFVEKPMALTACNAEEIIKQATQQNKLVMVGHLLRYHPAYQKVIEIIESGELGEVYYMYSTRVNLGVYRETENALLSLAPHDITTAFMYFGDEAVSVSAHGNSYLKPGIQDVVFVEIEFENNRMAHLHVSWLDPHKIRKTTIVGSKKMVVIDDMEPSEKVKIYDKGFMVQKEYASYGEALAIRGGSVVSPYIKMVEPLKLECEHFIDCIRNGTPPLTDAADGLRVVRVLEAAQRSLKESGRRISLDATT